MLSNSKNSIEIKAPAKINLFLEITGRLSNGYHTLESLMVPVSLYDFVEIEPVSGEKIRIKGSSGEIPEDETNIAWKAADLFFKKTGKKNGLNIKIKKNIPVEAGLGGGSSDAAAVLNGLNKIYKNRFTISELEEISAVLGADVPFFIRSVPALCTGIGDIIEPVSGLEKKYLIIINPGKGLSTAQVYKKLNWGLTNRVKKNKRLLFEDCLKFSNNNLSNDLQPVSEKMMPEISEIRSALDSSGAELAMMSGSGPTCYGIYSDKRLRDKACFKIRENFSSSWKIFPAEFL
ncbi:MAG: 4-(cytidine 5'-diphospho)-2-C-methyl-D-erythritol kinase [Thermodesulfobacteriota bacterium]